VSHGAEVLDRGIAAFVAFPQDERAEKTLNTLAMLPEQLSEADLVIYQKEIRRRITTLLSTPGMTESVKEGVLFLDACNEMAVQSLNQSNANSDLTRLRSKIDALESGRIDTPWIASDTKWLESTYEDLLTNVDPSAARQYWLKVAAGADREMAAIARGKLNVIELKLTRAPMEMKFTAVDGRPVDLSELRGKVVLVDFWATWCPPCLAEMPEIKRAYETYHDRGFEIVGISCEFAGVNPGDADDVRGKQLERGKLKLMKFTTRGNLPWPQYYDGMGLNQNAYALRFGVVGIPAMFLLDKEGMLVGTNAPGARMEIGQLVAKLLSNP